MDNNKKINTGGGAFINGDLKVGGKSTFVGRDQYNESGRNADETKKLFDILYAVIDNRVGLNNQDKADMKSEIDEIRAELAKKDQADESFLMRRLRNIGRMAPDILNVTVATITNPAAGFGMIAKKIADKAKASVK